MPSSAVTSQSVDYVQRCLAPPPEDMGGPSTAGAPETRRLLRVHRVGRPDEERERRPVVPEGHWRPNTTGLITGLYGYRIPLAFKLVGSADRVRVELGTWSAKPEATGAGQDRRRGVIASLLNGMYSAATLEEVADDHYGWPLTGVAVGVPAPAGIDEADGAAPIDSVIRSLVGTNWEVLILAYPVAETGVASVRAQVLNEIRATESAAKMEGAPSPLAEQYVELLKVTLKSLGEGLATGAWRTAVYLLGDGETYPRLGAAWRSVFSTERSLPEPVRVFDRPHVDALAGSWALPDAEGEPGPGQYRRPFEFQTLLTAAQLASYVHLPELEVPGFAVQALPRFDTVPAQAATGGEIPIARILQFERDTGTDYGIPPASLTRHAFVAGVTGSGKTNTILRLLSEADARGVPFLVIEPAKKEYRGLVDHPEIGSRLRVFTAGQGTVSPFPLNPLEVPAGVEVSSHIDFLRAVFGAAFAMWGPLPQILERCLHDVYSDRGWDLRTNTNGRVAQGDGREDAFPTLGDLIAKVGDVVPTLGYETVGDLAGALVTRLDSLRKGGKGAMLDSTRSLSWDDLLSQPTVVELEAMGDEGDKAFVAGLLLIRLAEHRRVQGPAPGLVHLLVIEEAHRLLANVPAGGSPETPNPRGHAVETFANLLSEIRAYGQGVVIADQIPVRLAPDVVKNTNFKLAHRIVSMEDREAMAGAMAMDASRAKALTSLATGQGVIFSAGDDAPLLVQVPLVKGALAPTSPTDERVREHMEQWRASGTNAERLLPRPFCAETCRGAPAACELARRLAADRYVQKTFARVVLSMFEDPGALDRLWHELVGVLQARRPPAVDEFEMLRAFAGHGADWFVARRGAQWGWSYGDARELRNRLQAVLLDKIEGGAGGARAALGELVGPLHERRFDPYPACSVVCTQSPSVCMYRAAAGDLARSGRYDEAWRDAGDADDGSEDGRRRETWSVLQDAAYELIEFPTADESEEARARMEDPFRRVALCFEQQMLAADPRKVPRQANAVLAGVLHEAGF
jgi:hypothetical protein